MIEIFKKDKTCTKCKNTGGPFIQYKAHGSEFIHPKCAKCYREYSRDMNRIYRAKDRKRYNEGRRRHRLKKKYGITHQIYEQMLASQNGVCAICFGPQNKNIRFSIDHNHKTGKVRELLCNNCNTIIGFCAENTQTLRNIIAYINKHSESNK